MKIHTKQQLENYTDKYVNYEKWLKKENDYYIFHYFKNSIASTEINKIIRRQNKAFLKITSFLKIKPPKEKIKYYLYPSQLIKKKLMGSSGVAQAIWHDFSVHIIYANKVKPLGEHEDTHLLSLDWGVTISFLQEGLAEYLSGNRKWYGKTQSFWLKDGTKKKIIPPIKTMMTQKAWMDSPDKYAQYYYVFAKSFVDFLVKKFGLEKFKKMYTTINRKNTSAKNIKIFEAIYKISIDEIQTK